MSNTDLKASLIISTYNWPEALELCLLSVLRQKTTPVEVIVADDGSTASTADLIDTFRNKLPFPITHVWQDDKGFRKSQILNEAIRHSKGNYIIQIDGDVILNPWFISDHILVAEQATFVRGTRAMLSPKKTKELLQSKNISLSCFSKGVSHRLNALRLFPFRILGIRKELSSSRVRGSNLAYWKTDFIHINGYDNKLQGWGHEDEELAARFINNLVIKKIVKLGAIQFHLHHPFNSSENEESHRETIEHVKATGSRFCENGYTIRKH